MKHKLHASWRQLGSTQVLLEWKNPSFPSQVQHDPLNVVKFCPINFFFLANPFMVFLISDSYLEVEVSAGSVSIVPSLDVKNDISLSFSCDFRSSLRTNSVTFNPFLPSSSHTEEISTFSTSFVSSALIVRFLRRLDLSSVFELLRFRKGFMGFVVY